MSDWPQFPEPWPKTRWALLNWLRSALMDLQDRIEFRLGEWRRDRRLRAKQHQEAP